MFTSEEGEVTVITGPYLGACVKKTNSTHLIYYQNMTIGFTVNMHFQDYNITFNYYNYRFNFNDRQDIATTQICTSDSIIKVDRVSTITQGNKVWTLYNKNYAKNSLRATCHQDGILIYEIHCKEKYSYIRIYHNNEYWRLSLKYQWTSYCLCIEVEKIDSDNERYEINHNYNGCIL